MNGYEYLISVSSVICKTSFKYKLCGRKSLCGSNYQDCVTLWQQSWEFSAQFKMLIILPLCTSHKYRQDGIPESETVKQGACKQRGETIILDPNQSSLFLASQQTQTA